MRQQAVEAELLDVPDLAESAGPKLGLLESVKKAGGLRQAACDAAAVTGGSKNERSFRRSLRKGPLTVLGPVSGRIASNSAKAKPSENQSSRNRHSYEVRGKSWRDGPSQAKPGSRHAIILELSESQPK
jgi:hypothetical protein